MTSAAAPATTGEAMLVPPKASVCVFAGQSLPARGLAAVTRSDQVDQLVVRGRATGRQRRDVVVHPAAEAEGHRGLTQGVRRADADRPRIAPGASTVPCTPLS